MLRDLEYAMKPATEEEMTKELVRLSLMTKGAAREEGMAEMQLAAYIEELSAYPGDLMREVLRGWRGTFWPAWGELAAELDRRVAPRYARLHALRHAAEFTDDEETTELTDKERAAIRAEIEKTIAYLARAAAASPI